MLDEHRGPSRIVSESVERVHHSVVAVGYQTVGPRQAFPALAHRDLLSPPLSDLLVDVERLAMPVQVTKWIYAAGLDVLGLDVSKLHAAA
jgi:hypothetical protein